MWTRVMVGIVPGFFAAAALTGLVCWLWPGPWESTLVAGLAAFFPLWIGIFCIAFRFSSSRRACGWLGSAAACSLALLWLLQRFGWVR